MLDRALTFRDAREDGAVDVAEIGRDTFIETFGHLYPPHDLKTYLDDAFAIERIRAEILDPEIDIRIAFAGRRIVAYTKIGPCKLPIDTGPDAALELHRIYVYRARQGVGVGRILLNWAIERARQRGAKQLFLGVFSKNHHAISVYENRGFLKVGEYRFPVGETMDDENIMRLDLTIEA